MKNYVNSLIKEKMKLKNYLIFILITNISCIITLKKGDQKSLDRSSGVGEVYIDLTYFSSDDTIYFMMKTNNGKIEDNIFMEYIRGKAEKPMFFSINNPSYTLELKNNSESGIVYYYSFDYKYYDYLYIEYHGFTAYAGGKLTFQCSNEYLAPDKIIIKNNEEKIIDSKNSIGLFYINLKSFSSSNTIYLMIKTDSGQLNENIYVTYINNLDNSPTGFKKKSPTDSDKSKSKLAYYYSIDYQSYNSLIIKYQGFIPEGDGKLIVKCSDKELIPDTTETVLIIVLSIIIGLIIAAGIAIVIYYFIRRKRTWIERRINSINPLLPQDTLKYKQLQYYSQEPTPNDNIITPA